MAIWNKLRDSIRLPRHSTGPNVPEVRCDTAAISQKILAAHYRFLANAGAALPSLPEAGFQVYSQTDEDGILLFLFSILGHGNRRCVEVCAGNGRECNTTNLLLHHGWDGLLIDGDKRLAEQGRALFADHPATRLYPPRFLHQWVTRENINIILEENGFSGEIDLLSIDIDGIDYWLWEAIVAVNPRVVVIEYRPIFEAEQCVTVPYSPDFRASDYPHTGGTANYAGASLGALAKLGARKGYRLVGCNRYGFNAFFLRNDVGPDRFPAVPVAACLTHPRVRMGIQLRQPTVAHLPWIEV